MLSYVQRGLADVWKENVMVDFEIGALEYESVGEFLATIKKEFGGEEEKLVKVAELRKLKQRGRIMEEFVQDFRKAARRSRYGEHPLIKEFKKDMNTAIRKRLMEAENQPGSIEQWFRRATALD